MTLELTRDQEEKLLKASVASYEVESNGKAFPLFLHMIRMAFPDKGGFDVELKSDTAISSGPITECLVSIEGYKFKASKEFGEEILGLVDNKKKGDEKRYRNSALDSLSSLLQGR